MISRFSDQSVDYIVTGPGSAFSSDNILLSILNCPELENIPFTQKGLQINCATYIPLSGVHKAREAGRGVYIRDLTKFKLA